MYLCVSLLVFQDYSNSTLMGMKLEILLGFRNWKKQAREHLKKANFVSAYFFKYNNYILSK